VAAVLSGLNLTALTIIIIMYLRDVHTYFMILVSESRQMVESGVKLLSYCCKILQCLVAELHMKT
jgi:hypothetical protein